MLKVCEVLLAAALSLISSRSTCAFVQSTTASVAKGTLSRGGNTPVLLARPALPTRPAEVSSFAITQQQQRRRPQQQQQQKQQHRQLMASPRLASSPGQSGDNSGATAAAAGAKAGSRFQGFEAALQKWCDRTTSLFPAWVLGAAAMGMCRPASLSWFSGAFITSALATTMVCMGMTLTLDDFAAVARRPRPVIAGVAAQYTIMPFLGYVSGRLFNLPPALAAGVTLVGCCPGGTASNLVTLIANGDVALSVSMTTVSTLLAAVVTGPLTKALVGALVDISAVALMKATAQVVFLPVALGLLLNTRAKGLTRRLAPYTPLLCVGLVALICGSVVAANSSILLGSGAALVGAVLTLHAGGFAVGYAGMRVCGFTEQEARTTSIEVGMQNSALAVVLAQRGLPDPASSVPGAVSATCHSLIGSALAAYWRTGDRGVRLPPPPSPPSPPPKVSAATTGGGGAEGDEVEVGESEEGRA